jgi:Flp pilus assembly protein TadG
MTTEFQRSQAGKKVVGSAAAWRRQRGNSLVEHALVITVLLAVMFGIVDCGRALYTYNFVSNAAREATRWASVRGFTCSTLCGGSPATGSDVQTFAQNVPAGMGLDPAKIVATTSWVAPPNNSPVCTVHDNNPGCIVKVKVEYDYSFFMPLMPSGQIKMTSTSEMIITQ